MIHGSICAKNTKVVTHVFEFDETLKNGRGKYANKKAKGDF